MFLLYLAKHAIFYFEIQFLSFCNHWASEAQLKIILLQVNIFEFLKETTGSEMDLYRDLLYTVSVQGLLVSFILCPINKVTKKKNCKCKKLIMYFESFVFFQNNCLHLVDEYTEMDGVLVLLDLLLHKIQAFRHIIFNRQIEVSWQSNWNMFFPLVSYNKSFSFEWDCYS